MAKRINLPSIFSEYATQVDFVYRRGDAEYSSSCPNCGTRGHDFSKKSDEPDRCRWFIDGRPRGWCRNCREKFWPGKSFGIKVSKQQIHDWKKGLEIQEEAKIAKHLKALQKINNAHPWVQWHEQMTSTQATYWRTAGIPKEWQHFWTLGYRDNYLLHGNTLPAYTIPNYAPWQNGKEKGVLNIQYRLVNPPPDVGKYRYEKGLQHNLYYTRPDWDRGDRPVVILEGAKKAMVLRVNIPDENLDFIAVPSKHVADKLLAEIKKTYTNDIYWALDPDAFDEADKYAQECPGSRVVKFPDKADDMLTELMIDPQLIVNQIRYAEKV